MSYPPVPDEFLKRERAQERRSSLLILLGGVLGIFVGVCTCGILVRLLGHWYYGPKYAEVAVLFSLAGLIVGVFGGAILGCVTVQRSPVLFLVTFVPLAIIFVLWMTAIRMSKPESHTVTIGCHQHLVRSTLSTDFRPLTSDF